MELTELVQAIDSLNASDAFRSGFTMLQWQTVAGYMIQYDVKSGETVIEQGETDRICYFLGRGSMQVYVTGGAPGSAQIAILRAGSIFGEPSLFGDSPRMASVSALTPCTLWALSGDRFEQMAKRVPLIALDFLRAAGVVMATRMRATLTRHTPFT